MPAHRTLTLPLAALLIAGCESDTRSTPFTPEVDAGVATDAGDAQEDEPATGVLCEDPLVGTGDVPPPRPGSRRSFTTELLRCSLSAAEAAVCYGAEHASSITLTETTIEITSNAIPNHAVGFFPNVGNPNTLSPQELAWTIPLVPTYVGTPTSVRVPGVALNGIKMEPATAERYADGAWRYEALTFTGRVATDTITGQSTTLGADCNFAHVQPTGEYHYQGSPTALMPEAPTRIQVGWAADGFPIYGRWGYADPSDGVWTSELRDLEGSYRVRDGERAPLDDEDAPPPGPYDGTFEQDWEFIEGLGDLDACNGREERSVIDGRTYEYAYYLTHTYPFMPRCLMGEPAAFAGATREPSAP